MCVHGWFSWLISCSWFSDIFNGYKKRPVAWNGLNSNLNKFLSSFSFSHKKHHPVTRSELLNVNFSLLFIWHCSKSVWPFAYELGTALYLHIQYIIKTQNRTYCDKKRFILEKVHLFLYSKAFCTSSCTPPQKYLENHLKI